MFSSSGRFWSHRSPQKHSVSPIVGLVHEWDSFRSSAAQKNSRDRNTSGTLPCWIYSRALWCRRAKSDRANFIFIYSTLWKKSNLGNKVPRIRMSCRLFGTGFIPWLTEPVRYLYIAGNASHTFPQNSSVAGFSHVREYRVFEYGGHCVWIRFGRCAWKLSMFLLKCSKVLKKWNVIFNINLERRRRIHFLDWWLSIDRFHRISSKQCHLRHIPPEKIKCILNYYIFGLFFNLYLILEINSLTLYPGSVGIIMARFVLPQADGKAAAMYLLCPVGSVIPRIYKI